jgi:hypothetical protein
MRLSFFVYFLFPLPFIVLLVQLVQPVKLLVVDPRVPVAVDAELFVRDEYTVGVLVLARDLVVGKAGGQLVHKVKHLFVPGNICHGQGHS